MCTYPDHNHAEIFYIQPLSLDSSIWSRTTVTFSCMMTLSGESVSNRISVMTNLMCQLGWATVSRYLVKHYGRCFGEGILRCDLHLNRWALSKADCPP